MFSKRQRLDQKAFSTVFAHGTKHHFPCYTIITSPAPWLRVAVVVGKKVSKLAVRRNRLKRRVYAGVQAELSGLPVTQTIIVLVKPCYATLSRTVANESLRKSIAQVCKSA